MIAGRSNTRMDAAFMATPGTGLGRMSAARMGSLARMGYLGDAGEFGDMYGPESDWGITYDWTAQSDPAPVMTLPATLPSSGGWDWQGALKSAPAMIRDLYVAKQTGDYQAKLNDVNIDRAKRGLPALPTTYAPQVNVGVAPGTAKLAGVGVGTIVIGGLVAAMLLRGGRRSRRR